MNGNINQTDLYTRLSYYSLLLSILGMVSYVIMFPSGIYYSFVVSAVGIAAGLLSRPYSMRAGRSSAAVVIGIINIAVCLAAFHGIHSLYTMLKDPVTGPQISSFVYGMLDQYGVSPEVFAELMKP